MWTVRRRTHTKVLTVFSDYIVEAVFRCRDGEAELSCRLHSDAAP